MAGPWFTVQSSGDEWRTLGSVWISDGDRDWQGRVEMRIVLDRGDDEMRSVLSDGMAGRGDRYSTLATTEVQNDPLK